MKRLWVQSAVSGLGEVMVTLGVVIGLYVIYLLSWTSVAAYAAARVAGAVEREEHGLLRPRHQHREAEPLAHGVPGQGRLGAARLIA
jgi:uncharacterized membrane protein YqiK